MYKCLIKIAKDGFDLIVPYLLVLMRKNHNRLHIKSADLQTNMQIEPELIQL